MCLGRKLSLSRSPMRLVGFESPPAPSRSRKNVDRFFSPGGRFLFCPRPEHRPAATSRRSLQACIASLPLQPSLISKTYLKSDHFNGADHDLTGIKGKFN